MESWTLSWINISLSRSETVFAGLNSDMSDGRTKILLVYFLENDPCFSSGFNVCVAVVDSKNPTMASSQLLSTGKSSVALCQKTLFTAAILATGSKQVFTVKLIIKVAFNWGQLESMCSFFFFPHVKWLPHLTFQVQFLYCTCVYLWCHVNIWLTCKMSLDIVWFCTEPGEGCPILAEKNT